MGLDEADGGNRSGRYMGRCGQSEVMLLKNLFKQSKPEEEFDPGEEPARVIAPTPIAQDLKKRTEERLKPQGGFDPYNSGTFKKENAWERVTRK